MNNGNRGTRFTLSRDELLTLPEFVLLSLFPNGLLPDGHMNSFHEGDVYPVDVRDETSVVKAHKSDAQCSMIPPRCNTCWIFFATLLRPYLPVHLRPRKRLTRPIQQHQSLQSQDPLVICCRTALASSSYEKTLTSTRYLQKPTSIKQR